LGRVRQFDLDEIGWAAERRASSALADTQPLVPAAVTNPVDSRAAVAQRRGRQTNGMPPRPFCYVPPTPGLAGSRREGSDCQSTAGGSLVPLGDRGEAKHDLLTEGRRMEPDGAGRSHVLVNALNAHPAMLKGHTHAPGPAGVETDWAIKPQTGAPCSTDAGWQKGECIAKSGGTDRQGAEGAGRSLRQALLSGSGKAPSTSRTPRCRSGPSGGLGNVGGGAVKFWGPQLELATQAGGGAVPCFAALCPCGRRNGTRDERRLSSGRALAACRLRLFSESGE
jgi:hypothetical protein